MAKPLTARQQQVLDVIRDYREEKGYPPSIRELREALGISSLRGVTIHLDALERKGWIERESTSRSIRILEEPTADAARHGGSTPIYIPLLGSIAAGSPILADENVESYLPLPPEIGYGDDLFALRVRGDSMVGDNIADGDVIVVRSQSEAEHGELVAALIEDEATVKRFDSNSQPHRLLPSNPDYSPIQLTAGDVRILGKVVGLIRTYASG